MSHRSRPLVWLTLAFLIGCGSTVLVTEDGESDGGGGSGAGGVGGSDTSVAVTSGPVTAVASTAVSSVSSTSSVSTIASSGAGGPFGEPDLFPQPLGSPANDRNVFTLSETALGAWVAARGPSNFSSPLVQRLTAPSGDTVFDGPLPSNDAEFLGYGVSSIVVPQVQHPESFPLSAGTWSVKVTDPFDPDQVPSYEVTAYERRTVDGAFHGGVLDVNVFLVPGVSDPDYIKGQVESAFEDFAGIELGALRFFDAPESLWEVNENNYFEAQEITASAPAGQAITLLAVGYIGGQFEGAAGFSPGAPADPIGHGSASSTLVWWVQNDGFFDQIIVRHETGHYAGLFHTSEFQPGLVDPLDDTPQCDDVMNQLDFCPDYDHIMFPTGGSGAGLLSPSQRAVIQGSAVYRGRFSEGADPAAPLENLVGQEIQRSIAAQAIAARGAKSLVLDGAGASARAPLADPTPRALRRSLAPEVAALDGIGCGTQGSVDAQIAEAARAVSARALVDLAYDRSAAPLLRMRALMAAGRAQGAAEVADELVALASDPSQPDAVRAGALRALDQAAPAQRAAIAPTLRGDASRLVRHLAR